MFINERREKKCCRDTCIHFYRDCDEVFVWCLGEVVILVFGFSYFIFFCKTISAAVCFTLYVPSVGVVCACDEHFDKCNMVRKLCILS